MRINMNGRCLLVILCLSFYFGRALATQEVNTHLPQLSLSADDGNVYDISSFKGKIVVMEWFNYGCPFVQKHYDEKLKNMQNLQAKYVKEDVVWLTITSSAKAKQGYISSPVEARHWRNKFQMNSSHLLLDYDGKLGLMMNAKTTPHMFIFDKLGNLVYQGAIDSILSSQASDISKAKNYVRNVLDDLLAGKKPTITQTRPYGCSVKF